MKHSIILKSVAIVLAAVALLAAVGGAIGLFALVDSGLYSKSVAELRNEKMEGVVSDVAESLVREYIARNLSDMTENALQNSGYFNGHEYYILRVHPYRHHLICLRTSAFRISPSLFSRPQATSALFFRFLHVWIIPTTSEKYSVCMPRLHLLDWM